MEWWEYLIVFVVGAGYSSFLHWIMPIHYRITSNNPDRQAPTTDETVNVILGFVAASFLLLVLIAYKLLLA